MKNTLTRIAFTLILSILFLAAALAQTPQIEVNATIPAGGSVPTSNEIVLGGRAYLKVNDRVLSVVDMTFSDAAKSFIDPRVDQITAAGEARVFLTGPESKARPWVSGGVAQTFFVGAPIDGANSTQATSSFGVTFQKANGFTFVPSFQFTSDDLQDGRTILGKEFAARFDFFVPLGTNFSLNFSPFVSRANDPVFSGDPAFSGYRTQYGLRIGFGRKLNF